MKKFILTLFYPWLQAVAYKSYEIYTTTDLYETRVQSYGISQAFHMYHHNVFDFWKMAFKSHWIRIIFTPWIFIPHSDIQKYEDMV